MPRQGVHETIENGRAGVSLEHRCYSLVASGVMHGDEHIVRREFLGIVPYTHHGIELPDGRIAENSPPTVRIVGYEDFTRGRPASVVSRDLDDAARDLAVDRALSMVGQRGYSLTRWNCEHFATWCATGAAVSRQVASWASAVCQLAGALLAVFLAAATARLLTAD
jgi:hypothetical protein